MEVIGGAFIAENIFVCEDSSGFKKKSREGGGGGLLVLIATCLF